MREANCSNFASNWPRTNICLTVQNTGLINYGVPLPTLRSTASREQAIRGGKLKLAISPFVSKFSGQSQGILPREIVTTRYLLPLDGTQGISNSSTYYLYLLGVVEAKAEDLTRVDVLQASWRQNHKALMKLLRVNRLLISSGAEL